MALIYLVGPHAIGKSTAIQRWQARYNRLRVWPIDQLRKAYYALEAKQALADECLADSQVHVIETARPTMGLKLNDCSVLIVTCSIEQFRQNMLDRCLAKGKPFRDSVWNRGKLSYEVTTRHRNFCQASGGQPVWFTVENRERDWPIVDEYFGQLYRSLNNQLNRRR